MPQCTPPNETAPTMPLPYTKLTGRLCVFCAEPAQHLHHTPSRHTQKPVWSEFWFDEKPRYAYILPVCAECNYALGKDFPWQLHKQAAAIFAKLNKKANAPVWTNEEINELGPALKSQVLAKQKRVRRYTNRTWRVYRRQHLLFLWEANAGNETDLEALLWEYMPVKIPQSMAGSLDQNGESET